MSGRPSTSCLDPLRPLTTTICLFTEALKAVEDAMSSDKFTIVIRDDGPPNGRKRRKPETVATIEFPGYYQFVMKIDRTEEQGILNIYVYVLLRHSIPRIEYYAQKKKLSRKKKKRKNSYL